MPTKKISSALSSPVAASGAAVLGRFLLLGTGALTGVLLPLCMSQHLVGLFFLSQSLIAGLATVGQLGLSITAPAFISSAIGMNDLGHARQVILRTCLIGTAAALALSVLFMLTLKIVASSGHSEVATALYSLAFIIAPTAFAAILVAILTEQHRALGHFVQASFLNTGAGMAGAAVVVTAWFRGTTISVELLLGVGLAGLGVGLAIGIASLSRWLRGICVPARLQVSIRDIIRQTIPNTTTTTVLFLVAQADLWIIAALGSTSDLAVYGLASRLAALIMVPLAIINTVITPSIGRLWVRGKRRYLQRVIGLGAGVAMILATTGYLVVIVFGKYLLTKVWSDQYLQTYYLFAMLGAAQLAQTFTGSAGYVLLMLGKQHVVMRISVTCGLVMMIVGALAMSAFGVIGLAVSYSAGGIIQATLMIYFVKRIFGLTATPDLKIVKRSILSHLHKRRNHAR